MGIMSTLKKTLGIAEEYDYEYENEYNEEMDKVEMVEDKKEESFEKENIIRGPFSSRNQMSSRMEDVSRKPSFIEEKKQSVSIVSPKSFDEALRVSEDFIAGKIIIINTSFMEIKVAQRFLDFVSGTSFAIGGDVNSVEDNIYILTPKSVSVDSALGKDSTFKNLFGF